MSAININAVRLVHVASAVFNLAFVYTQLHNWQYGFGVVQFITMPLLLISGYLLVRHRKFLAK